MAISTKWPVLLQLPIAATDVGADGRLTNSAITLAFDAACAAYLDECTTLDRTTIEVVDVTIAPGAPVAVDEPVTIATGAVEIYAERFTIAARIRSVGEQAAADVRASVLVVSGVTDEIRDELIALAHAARYYH
jgi:acyl-CoA thioesterase FadM